MYSLKIYRSPPETHVPLKTFVTLAEFEPQHQEGVILDLIRLCQGLLERMLTREDCNNDFQESMWELGPEF